jgi:hypothetical protein
MTEYALILAGVCLLVIVAVFLLGPQIGTLLNRVTASLGRPGPSVNPLPPVGGILLVLGLQRPGWLVGGWLETRSDATED